MARLSLSLLRRGTERDPEGRMPVMDHLRELRRRLLIVLIIVAAGAVVGWLLYDHILSILKHPYCQVPWQRRLGGTPDGKCDLLFFAPLDGFTTRLKVSVIAGAIITAPFWLYQVWAFVTPGLRRNERKWTVLFVITSTLLFAAGMILAYVVLSKGLQVIIGSAGSGTQAALSVTAYLSFVTLMLTIFGASFELPLLIVLLNMTGVLPFKVLKKFQRLAIFLIFVFAGVATPSTDPFTMCAMAVPMAILFEAAVLFSYVHDKRKARRRAEEGEDELADDEVSSIEALPERLDSDSGSWSSLP